MKAGTSNDRSLGLAIVSVGGVAGVMVVGDIVNDSSLQYVYTDHVVLSRRGHFDTLALPLAAKQAIKKQLPLDSEIGAGIATQPLKNLGQVIITRVFVDALSESVQGFYIEPGLVRRSFYDFGLRPEDLVTAVNGIILIDQTRAHAEAIINEMLTARQAVITMVRSHSEARAISLDVASWDPPAPSAALANDMRH